MDLPMRTPHRGPEPAGWMPVDGCTLPTAEQPLRAAEFHDLFAGSLRGVERPAGATTRARLVLAGGPGLRNRLQRLAAAETACCSFFSFTVTPVSADADGESLVLDIEVPASRADVLSALLDIAEQTREAGAGAGA